MTKMKKSYTLEIGTPLHKDILTGYVNLYWNDVYQPLFDEATSVIQLDKAGKPIDNLIHLLLMVKVIFEDSTEGYRTLGDMRKVNIGDKDLFIDYITQRLGILSDAYRVNPVSEIVFTAIKMSGAASNGLLLQKDEYQVTTHSFNKLDLPLTMDPHKYGTLLTKPEKTGDTTRYIVQNVNIFIIDITDEGTINQVNNVSVGGILGLK